MEKVLQTIHRDYARVRNRKVERRNKIILNKILNHIRYKMLCSTLFKLMFKEIFYGGSYYDKLKIKKADEFDIDIVLTLPKQTKPKLIRNSTHPHLMDIFLTEWNNYINKPNAERDIKQFLIDENVLSSTKFNNFFEKYLRAAVKEINMQYSFSVRLIKNDPAKTLVVELPDGDTFSVDLVVSFWFHKKLWPTNFRKSNTHKGFQIVPGYNSETAWRPSFQRQERIMLYDNDFVKPTIRLLKLFLDNENHKIVTSYYIKSIILWELERCGDSFKRKSFSNTFMHMLQRLHECIEKGEILDFWNDDLNMIANCDLKSLGRKLSHLICDVEEDPRSIEKYLDVKRRIKFTRYSSYAEEDLKDFMGPSITALLS